MRTILWTAALAVVAIGLGYANIKATKPAKVYTGETAAERQILAMYDKILYMEESNGAVKFKATKDGKTYNGLYRSWTTETRDMGNGVFIIGGNNMQITLPKNDWW